MKKAENINKTQNPALRLGAVSSSSSSDWRNDEYSDNDFDEDLEEEYGNSEAENCHCGAYRWSNGRWLHVSDCCC